MLKLLSQTAVIRPRWRIHFDTETDQNETPPDRSKVEKRRESSWQFALRVWSDENAVLDETY